MGKLAHQSELQVFCGGLYLYLHHRLERFLARFCTLVQSLMRSGGTENARHNTGCQESVGKKKKGCILQPVCDVCSYMRYELEGLTDEVVQQWPPFLQVLSFVTRTIIYHHFIVSFSLIYSYSMTQNSPVNSFLDSQYRFYLAL